MYSKGNYQIHDERSMVQLNSVVSMLKDSYWASERDTDTIQISIDNSVCFSLHNENNQIGFARVVTDFASVAYIADLIIEPHHRGKGLGKWLMEIIANDLRWKNKFQLLVTDDAHKLYEGFGFSCSNKLMSTKI